jgi:hypothetical protein
MGSGTAADRSEFLHAVYRATRARVKGVLKQRIMKLIVGVGLELGQKSGSFEF